MTDVSTDVAAAIDAKLDAEPDLLPVAETPAEAAPATEAPPPVAEPAANETATIPEPPSADSGVRSEPASQTQQSKDYEDWLTKFGGPTRDPNVAARATWDMNNRLAQQAKQETPAPPAPPVAAPAPEVPQELARFDGDLRALETKYAAITTNEKAYTAEHDRLDGEVESKGEEIDRLTRDLAFGRIDLEDEQAARKSLAALVRERDGIARKRDNYAAWIQHYSQEKAGIDRDWRITSALREQQARLVALNAREAEAKEKESQATLNRFGQTFFGSLPAIAKEGKETIPDDELADFKQFAQDKALIQLTAPNTNLLEADIPAFLRKVKTDYLAFTDRAHKRRSAAYARAKTADAVVAAPEGQRAVAEATKRSGFQSPQEVEAAIDAAFGA